MRGLKKSIKCMLCRHRKVCHSELSEISRLQWINRELTAEIDEYEKELQKVQNERDRLQKESEQYDKGYADGYRAYEKELLAMTSRQIFYKISEVFCKTRM